MTTSMRRFALLLALACGADAALAASGSVVISQIHGGPNTGPYKRDFVELHNAGTGDAGLAGMAIQYAAFDAATWTRVDLPDVVLPPGGYYLILLSSNGFGTIDMPAADLEGAISPGTASGKFALTATQVTLTGTCPSADLVDLVGYGSANCFEGAAAAPTGTGSATIVRDDAGCTDTDQNGDDFALVTISSSNVPRNSASPRVVCGASSAPDPMFAHGFENPINCNGDGSLVVSQVYAGTTSGPYKNDFAVLHNRGSTVFGLAGMALQTATATGTAWDRVDLPPVLLDPGQFFLIGLDLNSAGSIDLPPPDFVGTSSHGVTGGKVAVTATQVTLTEACPAAVVDLVGYGDADCFEGAAAAPAGTTSSTLQRFESGCLDTDENRVDLGRFAITPADAPRNTAAPAVICTCPGD
ncbi:MAG TPA: lamin tail domain-containing protein [Xanthomonadales bacterium]|nr:lamin tail domain-containing protein [Xanthomonadales bacterium]